MERGTKLRAVLQRVKRCSVAVEGVVYSEIGEGLLVLLGVEPDDGNDQTDYLADKILKVRIFPDGDGRMNLSALDVRAGIMVVSQFTLLANCSKGRRPSFVAAAPPEKAEELYRVFVGRVSDSGLTVRTGVFGAMMNVRLDNWGPVTFIVDTPPKE